MKKWLVLGAGGVMAASSLAFQGTASAAPAAVTGHPSGCETQSNVDNGGMARCKKSNGGHYKATVLCTRWDGGRKITRDAVKWVSSGWSSAYCPPETSFSSVGIVTKPD